jgi:hypothetical protein
MQRILMKKSFLFTVGNIRRVKRFKTRYRNSLKDVRKSQMMPDQVALLKLRQSKDFYVEGLDALVKRWDKCYQC